MSFLDKVIHGIKGAANDAVDKHQNLGANARQTVRDLEDQLNKAESALVDVRAEAEVLNGKRATHAAEVQKWLDAATRAAGKDDNLARECLQRKAAAASQLKAIDDQIAKFQPTVAAIERRIAELRNQKDTLANQADLIGVRSEVADVETRAAEILGGVGGSSVSLAAEEEALAKKEAHAHAASALADEHSGASLDARLAALDSGPSIDDELAALKAGK